MTGGGTYRLIARRVILLAVTMVVLTLAIGLLVAWYTLSHSTQTEHISDYHFSSIRLCGQIKDEVHHVDLVCAGRPEDVEPTQAELRDVGSALFVLRSATAEVASIQERFRGNKFVQPVERTLRASRGLGTARELFEARPEEVRRKTLHALDCVEQLQRLHVVSATRSRVRMEAADRARLIWMVVAGAFLLVACLLGSYRYMASIRQVVLDRELAHREASGAHERLARAQRMAGMGSWEWDPQSDRIILSSALSALLGEPPEERSLSREEWLTWVHPEDREPVAAALEATRRGEPRLQMTHRIQLPDRRLRHVLCDAAVGVGGDSGSLVGSMLDVTHLARAHEERSELERQVQHAQKLKSLGVLAGGIAHDFNNLLVGILGNAKFVRMELEPGSKTAVRIDRTIKSAERAAELCRQLLAYAGRGQFVIEPVDLSQVIADVGSLLDMSADKQATVRYHLADGLPAVEADATQLRQVAMNLIMNASDAVAGGDGRVTVTTDRMFCDAAYLARIWLDNDLPPGDYVFLEVADTGCGIPAGQLAQIFDPFFTSKPRGHGLGLAATLGIVRSHRAALAVKSEVGVGTTIRVLFPASAKEAPAETPLDGPESGELPRGVGTVLVVDDEEGVRELARDALEEAGLRVLTAADGRECVEAYRRASGAIDLVLLDLTMPEMGGEATFRELRRIDPRVRVVLSSGYSEQDTAAQLGDQNPSGFLRKPYAPTELLEMVLGPGSRDA